MWNHRPWLGHALPPSVAPSERLRAYAQWCNAVEGNTTFYATPAIGTVQTWARQTSPDFRFLVKLPKTITHEGRLGDVDRELRAFLTAIEPLGPRAHALWVQLPGSFAPADLDALAGFLGRLPSTYRIAVEVRHRAFFDDSRNAALLERVLAGVHAEWVTFDTTVLYQSPPTTPAERESWERKPRMPRRAVALTEHPVVRYIGRDDVTQTIRGWQYWLDTVAEWLREGRSPTVFIHTPDNADALTLARRFHEAMRDRLPEIEPLAEPTHHEPLTLF
ncbi:DUF72 domain-containing protein [Allorhizocola rhizosphaerae]|uniref:DUF72 domain-containing protein n=1 Tax=Allorhizocola rhizosphaerae TaxID=1872709 RepID=UPI000E3C7313|nr:DUF72 domain-containing protein [Allorhizocola rhizosphaerae]